MDIHTIENFYGVYLLYCLNPKYLGRTYIGYTVDPNRRIKQHNKGSKYGGAWKTSQRGPWSMVLIIHGFPNDIAALRFEWAWQHPHASRRLHHVSKKKAKEKVFDFCIRVLSEMLLVGPWNRLPLSIRWLNQEYVREFPGDKTPPMHMPICYGSVISKKVKNIQSELSQTTLDKTCSICKELIPTNGKTMQCLNTKCDLMAHILCLSKYFQKIGDYVPIEGTCPQCNKVYLWGDLVRKYKGCYNNCDVKINLDTDNDYYCSESE